jgi:cell division transport system permease protein
VRPALRTVLGTDTPAARLVPPSGMTAVLTVLTAGAMAFLAVFATALSLAATRLADRWEDGLARTATVRISAPADQLSAQTEAALSVLRTTPGVAAARALDDDEQRALLAPWFGPDLPVEALTLPRLIEVTEDAAGLDAEGLRQRLLAEAPGAVLDDHGRWRAPLLDAAGRLRQLGLLAVGLIALALGATVTLAAGAALAANQQVIRVLRLVGAQDRFIAGAFERRFTFRAFLGATLGTSLGYGAVSLLPAPGPDGGLLTGLGFQGLDALWPLAIPIFAAGVAYLATRAAASRTLKGLM